MKRSVPIMGAAAGRCKPVRVNPDCVQVQPDQSSSHSPTGGLGSLRSGDARSKSVQSSFVIVEEFFERAGDLRRAFEEHFARPGERAGDGQQIWDYWHVPGS